jgi:hypothetical protein
MTITAPSIITQPFAYAGDVDPLPSTDIDPNVANQQTGYPPIQSQPVDAGGEPFTREQTNGVLNYYTNIIRWQNVGGTFTFDSAASTDLGGYNLGAVLSYTRSNGTIGFLASTVDNNTNNFISNPSVIGTQWIDTVQGFYPSITEDITTGAVIIGNRVNGQTLQMRTSNAAVSGNIPYSQVVTITNGLYPQSFLATANGISDSIAQVQTTYINGGDGTFKPAIVDTVQTPDGYLAKMSQSANSAVNGYMGFLSQINNTSKNGTSAILALSPDSSDNAASVWVLSNTNGSYNSGFEQIFNSRPRMVGNLNTLTTSSSSLLTFGDFTQSFATPSGYVKYPNGIIIQWGFVNVTDASVTQTIIYPIAFPNATLSVLPSVSITGGGQGCPMYWGTTSNTNAALLLSNVSVSGTYSKTGSYFAIGY